MTRHAFLIIAHDNFAVLGKLLEALAHPRVDLYLHIDAKVKRLPPLDRTNPHLHVIDNRVDTRWGDISQIETEYVLLEAAVRHGGYAYYHLISGTHFPLMPVGQILQFFDNRDGKTVFHDLCTASRYQESLKLRSYNLLTRNLGYGPPYLQRLCQVTNRIGHRVQSFLKVERHRNISFHKASNWASFTEEAVRLLIDRKDNVMHVFRYSFCGDEFFAPTVLMNSDLKDKVENYERYLKIEMGEANPRVLRDEDYSILVGSGYMFARKFSDTGIHLIDRIIQSYES